MHYIDALQDQLGKMAEGFMRQLPTLVIAVLILIVTFGLARFAVRIADKLTHRSEIRADLKQLFDTLLRLAIWVVGALVALTVAVPSFTPAGAFASLGVGALAIGFAFQDIFENFLAGVLIMLRESMNIGDAIECQSITGTVERITLRETHIRQPTHELTIVPNSMLFKNPVKVTSNTKIKRDEITVGISYDADVGEAETLIREAVRGVSAVLDSPAMLVAARQFGASSIDILAQWWTDSGQQDMNLTRSEVIRAVKTALDGAGIAIPYPTVANQFEQPLALRRAAKEQREAA